MRVAPVVAIAEFRAGDNVVLGEGPYQSTTGVFLKLREDVRWAEIEHWNGVVQSHPVEWLRHAGPQVAVPPEQNRPRKTA